MTCARSAPGRRRLTPEHHHATAIATRFDGLPAGVTKKSQLLAAFKQATEALGVSARLRDAVDTLMSWSEQQGWLGDSRPIVWPSNQRLQDAWGISKRQVQNILNRLIRLGLITAVDGTEGRRWGKRDKEGRIIDACGLDLSPLAVRFQEFAAAAAEHRKKVRATRRPAPPVDHRSQGDPADRRDRARTRCPRTGLAKLAAPDRSPMPPAPPSALDLDVLPALVEQLEAIRSEGDAALAAFFNPVESAPAGEVPCAANTATNTLSADTSATCKDAAMKSNGCGRSGSSRPAGHDQALAQNAATAALAPGWLARLCQPLRAYLADERPSWSEVVDAADYLRASLGISRSAWIDACHTLGRNDAAAAVAIIAARGDEISSPGGYLRGMTGKARAGRLNLMGSLLGLAERRHDG